MPFPIAIYTDCGLTLRTSNSEEEKMQLESFTLEELLLTALKSEIESRDIYKKISMAVSNALLKDRFEFLAGEEEKHREFIEHIYKGKFPDREIKLPDKTPVPLPEVKFETEDVPLSEILDQSMKAELAAHDFYKALAEKFPEDREVRKTLLFFSSMEMGHYQLLKLERENIERFEEWEEFNPMVHIGA